jgi:alkylation response protein AidB-like acyl-CoA dehydrogenase
VTPSFHPSDDERMLQDAVRAFAGATVRERAPRWDRDGKVDSASLHQIAELGLLGLWASEANGGLGTSSAARSLALESLGDAGLGLVVLQHGLATAWLERSGTAWRKAVAQAAIGSEIWTLAHAEDLARPDSTPSRTRAVLQPDGTWRISGSKRAVFGIGLASRALVTAATDAGVGGFAVDLTDPGVALRPCQEALGLRSAAAADLSLDCAIAAPTEGPIALIHTLDNARLGVAALALGVARSALTEAARYAGQRQQFGKAIAQFQPIQWMIADSATEIAAAECLVHRAAWQLDLEHRSQGRSARSAVAMACSHACKAAVMATDRGLQVHGGYGYTSEFPIERLFRDASVLQMAWGTPTGDKTSIWQGFAAP